MCAVSTLDVTECLQVMLQVAEGPHGIAKELLYCCCHPTWNEVSSLRLARRVSR